MTARIKKKILGRYNHPRRNAVKRQLGSDYRSYAISECIRLGLDSNKWSTMTISFPASINYWNLYDKFVYSY